jgi:hypothetical protein
MSRNRSVLRMPSKRFRKIRRVLAETGISRYRAER